MSSPTDQTEAKRDERISQLHVFAAQWEARAKSEDGKTAACGWTSREINAAEQRAIHYRSKRDACLQEIARLVKATGSAA